MARPGGTGPVAAERALDEYISARPIQPIQASGWGLGLPNLSKRESIREDLKALRWTWFTVGWISCAVVASALLLVL